MNKDILKTGVQSFIDKNWNTDIMSVLLKKSLFAEISQRELVEQLEGKKRCQNKLPTWFGSQGVYYPNKLNIEQASSERAAGYKAKLVFGNSLIDLTGGLGVDSFYFSKQVGSVTYCEWNTELAEIASHNFLILGAKNIACHNTDGITFLQGGTEHFDWVYIDPSRRDDAKGKVFLLGDCYPNLPKHLNSILKKTTNVLVKTSPLLDLKKGLSELQYVKEIHVLAVQNEVKEVLWILKKGYDQEPLIKAINLRKTSDTHFEFKMSEEAQCDLMLGLPENYLYEPNAALLKAGPFKRIGHHYGLKKLHQHSHLYTNDEPIHFPGRRFEILEVLPYSKENMRTLNLEKANITTRNFPESVAQIRKKYKISDGGDCYLFFTTGAANQKMVLRCKKV